MAKTFNTIFGPLKSYTWKLSNRQWRVAAQVGLECSDWWGILTTGKNKRSWNLTLIIWAFLRHHRIGKDQQRANVSPPLFQQQLRQRTTDQHKHRDDLLDEEVLVELLLSLSHGRHGEVGELRQSEFWITLQSFNEAGDRLQRVFAEAVPWSGREEWVRHLALHSQELDLNPVQAKTVQIG